MASSEQPLLDRGGVTPDGWRQEDIGTYQTWVLYSHGVVVGRIYRFSNRWMAVQALSSTSLEFPTLDEAKEGLRLIAVVDALAEDG